MTLDETPPCSPRETRGLLRALRDLNMIAQRMAIRPGEWVGVEGCTSRDAPVEQGVRYRLRLPDGSEGTLGIAGRNGRLDLSLAAPGVCTVQLSAPLERELGGRATARRLAARLGMQQPTRRELEHFLRRIVRSVMAA